MTGEAQVAQVEQVAKVAKVAQVAKAAQVEQLGAGRREQQVSAPIALAVRARWRKDVPASDAFL